MHYFLLLACAGLCGAKFWLVSTKEAKNTGKGYLVETKNNEIEVQNIGARAGADYALGRKAFHRHSHASKQIGTSINSSRGSYGHNYSDDNGLADIISMYDDECKKDADCLTLCDYGDCAEGDLFCNKEGYCEEVVCDPATMGGCEGCSANQCYMMEDKKECVVVEANSGEHKCVSKTCTNNKDCRKLDTKLCEGPYGDYGDCEEGDLFCNKEGTCEQVVCDPATMGGCEGCSYNQCWIMEDEKDCMVVSGKSREEDKCVSKACTNTEDCRNLFVNSPGWLAEKYECKNGTCESTEDDDDDYYEEYHEDL